MCPQRCGLYLFPISAGLAPTGSQLASYNERSKLARSPSGLPRWKQRLVGKLGSSRSVPAGELSSRCFHPDKPEGEHFSQVA